METTIYEILTLLKWILPRRNYLQARTDLQYWILNEQEQFLYISNPVSLQMLELWAFLKAEKDIYKKTYSYKVWAGLVMLQRICILPEIIISKQGDIIKFIVPYKLPGKILREVFLNFFRTRVWDRTNYYYANPYHDYEYSAQAVYILKKMNATPGEALTILLELEILTETKNTYKDEQN